MKRRTTETERETIATLREAGWTIAAIAEGFLNLLRRAVDYWYLDAWRRAADRALSSDTMRRPAIMSRGKRASARPTPDR